MEENTRITRFADVIVEPKTQHAWVLRANHSNGDMECECLRCGRVETLTSIDSWNKAQQGRRRLGGYQPQGRLEDRCREVHDNSMPVSRQTGGLQRGPMIAVHPLEAVMRRPIGRPARVTAVTSTSAC